MGVGFAVDEINGLEAVASNDGFRSRAEVAELSAVGESKEGVGGVLGVVDVEVGVNVEERVEVDVGVAAEAREKAGEGAGEWAG